MKLEEKIKSDIEKNREKIKELGPGIITGGAGDDPAGIVTYTMVGITTGLSQLWLLLLSTPMMIAVQNMAASISMVTGKSLPEITKAYYSKTLTIFMVTLLGIANILTIGADLYGVSTIFHIISGYKTVYFLIPITALIGYLVTFGRYKLVKKVLITFTALLGIYFINVFMAKPDLILVLKNTFIPDINWNAAWIMAALGMLGTTISPYLLFWQASEEKEEKKSVAQAKEVNFDTIVGMIYSNLLAYCMIITGAVTLYGVHISHVDVQTLATTLKPSAGEYAFMFFSLGIIVSGFLAIPVLAGSTAYAIADTFGWREGMDEKVSDAKGFYIVFLSSLLFGDLIGILPNINAVDALYYSQVLDGILIPVLIAILFFISNNKKIMGEYTTNKFNNIFAVFAFLVTLILTLIMFYQLIK